MTTRRLFVWILALALLAMSVRETLDPDMWWHLRTGEFIWQTRSIPEFDVFSFTVPDHVWIVQQWLTDVLMWLVYEAGGLWGLSLMFALVVALSFMLVYARCAGRPYLAGLVILVAYLAAALPIGVRPQMFNMLFLALFIFLIEGVREGKLTARALWWLPLLTLLWANMHSGYLTGVALLGAYVVGESLQRRLGQPIDRTLSWAAAGQLAAIIPLSLAAALVNPHGLDLLLFPLGTLGSEAIQSNIVEWYSPDFHLIYFWFFGGMMALAAVSLALTQRPVTWTDVILVFGPAAGGLLSARHISLFAVAAAPVISRHLLSSLAETRLGSFLAGERPSSPTPTHLKWLNWGVFGLMVLAVTVWIPSRLAGNEAALARQFPVAAVDFLEAEELADERIYNTYEWGGYLIWRRIPVFIDGRTELYGNDFFLYYLQATRLHADWQEPLDEMDVTVVLLRRTSALATLLAESDAWRSVYEDDVARIFVRN